MTLGAWLATMVRPPARRSGAWQIELTSRCALACRMCIRRGPDAWHHRDMRLEEFDAVARGFPGVETVILQGWGEPLLHPRLIDVVRRAKVPVPGRGDAPRVGFVTSGQGLDRRCAEALVEAGLDFLGLSVAGASPATHAAIRVRSTLDEVVAAAEHVAAARRGAPRPRVHLAFLMMRDNVDELPGLPALARRMGAEEIVLTNLVHAVDAWQEGQRVFAAAEAPRHARALADAVRSARALGVALRGGALGPTAVAVCEEDPLRNLYVTVDGEVSPCVYLCPPVAGPIRRRVLGCDHLVSPLSFGNAFHAPVAELREAPAYRAFRARFLRRAQRQRLLALLPASWRGGPGTSPDGELPDPPDPCRTCPKLLGA
jgi:MoaA/NifB/PqqE/SkfB family radical SAM enzyme